MTTSHTDLAAQARAAAEMLLDINARPDRMQLLRTLEECAQALENKGEPVMIYRGRHPIDCGEFGSHDMEMLRLIPAGTKLYAAGIAAIERAHGIGTEGCKP
jgi:hypothetical protein